MPQPDCNVSSSESPLLLKRRPNNKAIPIITRRIQVINATCPLLLIVCKNT